MPLSFMPPKGAISPAGFWRDDAFVDTYDAVFERLGDAPDAADVAAVELGGEPKLGVVGHLDRVRLALEAIERRDRAKVSSLVITMSVVTIGEHIRRAA